METLFSHLATAAVTLLVALAGFAYKARLDKGARVESEAKEQRLDVYRRIVDMFFLPVDKPEMRRLAIDVVLFASDDVVRVWTSLVNAALRGVQRDTPEAMALWRRLLLAMRKDSSRPHTTLTGDEVLAALGIQPDGRIVPFEASDE